MKISEKNLITLHLSFIAFSYLWAISMPFYLGILLIFLHKAHEDIMGDCYLTKVQKDKGYSGEEDDFFYYLFNIKNNFNLSRQVTSNMHWFIKITIAIIVMIKTVLFLT